MFSWIMQIFLPVNTTKRDKKRNYSNSNYIKKIIRIYREENSIKRYVLFIA